MGRIRFQTGPHDPAKLAMRLNPASNELGIGSQDEISLQPLPEEMKFILIKPHVGS